MGNTPSPARPFALMIISLLALGAGLSAVFTLRGDIQTGLLICGGTLGIAVLVLVVGGLVVARLRPPE